MSEFTYSVFVVVATMAAALIGVFTAGVIGVLIHDAKVSRPAAATPAAAEPSEYRHAA